VAAWWLHDPLFLKMKIINEQVIIYKELVGAMADH
jgi:hypothetical protein